MAENKKVMEEEAVDTKETKAEQKIGRASCRERV